jgi:Fur family peroxide stress response transcriptional regulator
MAPKKRMERLRNLGMTPTIQRVAVLEYLESTNSHPTADQVLSAIREKYPSLSRATVYNTLEALTKAGAILKLSIDTPAARYDADLEPHGHFRCRLCGKLEDIDLPDISCLEEKVSGHRVETIHAYAYGICSDCGKREQKSTQPGSTKRLESDDEGGRPDARAS